MTRMPPFDYDQNYYIGGVVNQVALEEAIMVLAATQTIVSKPVPGCITEKLTKDQVRTYGFAMIDEILEFCRVLGWKPWKLEAKVDKVRVAEEMADILAFLGILFRFAIQAGVSPRELAAAYADKSVVNIDRIAGQYKGYGIDDHPLLRENKE